MCLGNTDGNPEHYLIFCIAVSLLLYILRDVIGRGLEHFMRHLFVFHIDENRKLVACKFVHAQHKIGEYVRENPCKKDQYRITDAVAEDCVDLLEIIHIDEKQRW